MKIKENYALSAIAGSNVVFPIDMSEPNTKNNRAPIMLIGKI